MTNLISTKKLSKGLQQRLDGFELVRDFLVLKPTDHVVSGLLFDRSSQGNGFYLYRLVSPLFSPVMPNLSLNYSERICECDTIPVFLTFEENDVHFNDILIRRVLDEVQRVLAPVKEVDKFLDFFKNKDVWRPNMKLEIAIANYLVGRAELSKSLLLQIVNAELPSNPLFDKVVLEAERAILALDNGGTAMDKLIRQYEHHNVTSIFKGITLAN